MPTFLCLEPVPARTAVTSSQIDTHKMNLVYTTELLWLGIGYIFHQEKGYTERCVFYHIDVILGATSETTQNPFYFPAKALYLFQLRDGKWKQRNVKNRTEERYCQRNNNRSTDQANQSLTALLNLNTIIEQSWGKILKRTKYLQKYTHTHTQMLVFHHAYHQYKERRREHNTYYLFSLQVPIAIISLMFYRPKSTLENMFLQTNPLWLKQRDMSIQVINNAETEQTQGLLNSLFIDRVFCQFSPTFKHISSKLSDI